MLNLVAEGRNEVSQKQTDYLLQASADRASIQRLSARCVSTGKTAAARRPAWDPRTTSLPPRESRSKSASCGFWVKKPSARIVRSLKPASATACSIACLDQYRISKVPGLPSRNRRLACCTRLYGPSVLGSWIRQTPCELRVRETSLRN